MSFIVVDLNRSVLSNPVPLSVIKITILGFGDVLVEVDLFEGSLEVNWTLLVLMALPSVSLGQSLISPISPLLVVVPGRRSTASSSDVSKT